MPEVNRRQGQVPRGAIVLDNPNGTAPGLFIDSCGARGRQIVILLPGPPRELQPMFDAVCSGPLPRARRAASARIATSLFITGRGESHVEQIVQPIYARWRDAVAADLDDHSRGDGADRAAPDGARDRRRRARRRFSIAPRAELLAVIADDVYSTDGRAMEEVVGDLLKARGLHDRRRGILHRRPVHVPPHRRRRAARPTCAPA